MIQRMKSKPSKVIILSLHGLIFFSLPKKLLTEETEEFAGVKRLTALGE